MSLPTHGHISGTRPYNSHRRKKGSRGTAFLLLGALFLTIYIGFAVIIGVNTLSKSDVGETVSIENGLVSGKKPILRSKPPQPSSNSGSRLLSAYPSQPLDPEFDGAGPGWWLKHKIFRDLPVSSYDDLPTSIHSFIESTKATTQGVMLLGMHRSATSLLAGLLVEAFSVPVGPSNRLIGAAFDNPKGFYEFRDVVLQNDDTMKYQWRDYGNVENFSPLKAATDVLEMGGDVHVDGSPYQLKVGKQGWHFNFGKGAEYLDIMQEYPVWLQKDPRMCLTFSSWFPLLELPPAVIFTYRSPIDVASSMFKRDGPIFPISRGIRLWLMYNRHALQNSDGLCTVFSTSKRMFGSPIQEIARIRSELKNTCKIDLPNMGEITKSKDVVNKFYDPNLIHQKKKAATTKVNTVSGLRGCTYPEWRSSSEKSQEQKTEEDLYKLSMQVYCDLEVRAVPTPPSLASLARSPIHRSLRSRIAPN
jgi:hypothetical protein